MVMAGGSGRVRVRAGALLLLVLAAIAPAAARAAPDGVSGEQVYFAGVVAAVVGAVIGAVTWFRREVKQGIAEHEQAEFSRSDARDKLEAERHQRLLAEIAHVRELVDIRGELRALRQEREAVG